MIGRPRFSQQYIKTIMGSKYITNWRMQKVYTPYIIKMLENNGWDATDKSHDEILQMLERLPRRTEKVNDDKCIDSKEDQNERND